MPIDTALRIEQRYFTEILQIDRSGDDDPLAVRLAAGAQQGRAPAAGVQPTKFKKIGVLGAGFMGAGIAYVTAKAGIPVVLIDRDVDAAEKGKAHSAGLMDEGSSRRAAPPRRTRKSCCR